MPATANSSIRGGFSLVELLVTIAVLGLLAGLLLPALAKATKSARRIACLSNLHQRAFEWHAWLGDNDDRFPDRRDLKQSLPGGYRPWSTWPKSDPRAGWAAVVLEPAGQAPTWICPAVAGKSYANIAQARQMTGADVRAVTAGYWMWRFDRADEPVPDDNFWGRTVEDSVQALRRAGNPAAGYPGGPEDVELMVDIYFPNTISSLPQDLRGRSAHPGGRNRLMLDGSAAFLRDARTPLD